jgi:hypothetical protein
LRRQRESVLTVFSCAGFLFLVGLDYGMQRKSLVDLTLSASGRATFKQESYAHAHQLFVSSASSMSDDTMLPGGLTNDATAWAWGSGKYGRLGLGSTADASVPAPVAALYARLDACCFGD